MQDNPFTREGAEFDKSYRIAYLIAGFIQENLSPAEREELDDWVGDSNDNLILFEELTDEQNLQQSLRWFRELDMERARKRVQKKNWYRGGASLVEKNPALGGGGLFPCSCGPGYTLLFFK